MKVIDDSRSYRNYRAIKLTNTHDCKGRAPKVTWDAQRTIERSTKIIWTLWKEGKMNSLEFKAFKKFIVGIIKSPDIPQSVKDKLILDALEDEDEKEDWKFLLL